MSFTPAIVLNIFAAIFCGAFLAKGIADRQPVWALAVYSAGVVVNVAFIVWALS